MKILTGIPLQQTTYTSSTTLGLNNAGKLVIMNVASSNNVTVPPNASVNFQLGTVIHILQYGLGQTTIVAGSGVTILANNGNLVMGSAGEELITGKLTKIDTNTWLFENNINFTDLSNLNASNLTQGTVPTARLGSGTANSTTYLRGDNTWATVSAGGLTKFTEAQSTASPNATVNVDSLTAVASTTDADISIVPKGMGSFLLAIPDNTTAGGNKRGLYSVDLQTAPRATADQVCSGNYASLLGGYRSKANADHAIAGGNQNVASGYYSLAFGGQGNIASGSYSIAMGQGNIANNTSAVAIGYTNTASGGYSFTSGYTNSITNTYAFALGNNNSVSAISSFGLGSNNTVSGGNGAGGLGYYNVTSGGTAFGIGLGNYADGDYSICLGARAKAFGVQGRICHMADYITTQGEFQTSEFILGKRTTDATQTTLSVNFGVASAINQVVLQNNNVFRFKGQIVGKQSGSTNVGVWDFDGIIVRGSGAGTTTLVGTPTVTAISNLNSWGTPVISADTTLGCLKVEVIGLSATNIHWMCKVETTEAIYA